jgi:hypothetical protein
MEIKGHDLASTASRVARVRTPSCFSLCNVLIISQALLDFQENYIPRFIQTLSEPPQLHPNTVRGAQRAEWAGRRSAGAQSVPATSTDCKTEKLVSAVVVPFHTHPLARPDTSGCRSGCRCHRPAARTQRLRRRRGRRAHCRRRGDAQQRAAFQLALRRLRRWPNGYRYAPVLRSRSP